jgi:serine/threonine protein kinase
VITLVNRRTLIPVLATTPSITAAEKHPGAEPLPGYCLLKLLGRGGFGEVWKCEAPGRLHKAIKFVPGGDQFRTELAAFEHMRTIRHPYLMTLERVEAVAGELVMVMELADGQTKDRFHACVADGLRGIPRDELLGYLDEAAEALDFLSSRYRLQHLDVKPENLLLLAGHVKLGDYGLVRCADPRNQSAEARDAGFTPRYTAPEVINGGVDHRSDQYSLALVYVELLTGAFAFSGKTPQQLLMQHLAVEPDLAALPAHERKLVARALAKEPARRFASSSEFIRALIEAAGDTHAANVVSEPDADLRSSAEASYGEAATIPNRRLAGATDTPCTAGPAADHPPPAAPVSDRPGTRPQITPRNTPPPPPKPAVLQLVVSTDQLNGMPLHKVPAARLSIDSVVRSVVTVAAQACPAAAVDAPSGSIVRHFLSTVPAALVPLKLAVVATPRTLSIDQANPGRVLLRYEAPAKMRLLARPRKSGYEVAIHFPADGSAEFTLVGSLFGSPDLELVRRADGEIEAVMDAVTRQLQTRVERRAHRRFPADFPVLVYPYYADGEVDTPVAGQCRDISEGGIRIVSALPIRAGQIYIEFKEPAHVVGSAVLAQVVRTGQDSDAGEFVTAGRFGATA